MSTTILPLILSLVVFPYSDPDDIDAHAVVPWATTCPAGKKATKQELPAEVKAALDGFRQALRDSDWDKALRACTERTQARAKEHPSREQYLRDAVPLKELLAEAGYNCCGGSVSADSKMARYDFFVRLPEHPGSEATDWEWGLERTEDEWLVDLPDVSVEQGAQEQIARCRRERERAEARWKALEPKLEGLRTRLTAQQSEYRVGQPMLFRLELVNDGRHELFFDRQQVAVNASMTITHEDGRVMPYTAGPVQTVGSSVVIESGTTAVLFENFDIAKQYDMTRPGKYRVRFNGHGLMVGDKNEKGDLFWARRLFPSNAVEIEVQAGLSVRPENNETTAHGGAHRADHRLPELRPYPWQHPGKSLPGPPCDSSGNGYTTRFAKRETS